MLKAYLPLLKDVLVLQNIINQGSKYIHTSASRCTVIVERKKQVRLAKLGMQPRLRKKDNLYQVVEREHNKPISDITCILSDYVEGIGGKGDVVTIKRSLFRNQLYPAKLAVYASPENMAENELYLKKISASEQPRMTAFAKKTMEQIGRMYLPIPMSGDNQWTLNKEHVRLAFRKVGVEMKDHCIQLPDEPITGPQQLTVHVSVNGLEAQSVKAHIYLIHKDPSKNQIQEIPTVWHGKPKPVETEKSGYS